MPAFVFVGDDGEGPDSLSLFGLVFDLDGEPVEVEDPHAVAKLRGNRHFRESPAGSAAADVIPMQRKGGWPKGKPRKVVA